MTIEYVIDPHEGWSDQVGLRLRCTADEAQAVHRALRVLFRGRMSPVLPRSYGEFPFVIFAPATKEELERRWVEVLQLAGLAPRSAPPTQPPQRARIPPEGGQRPPVRGIGGGRPTSGARRAPGSRDPWEQRFRAAVRAVFDSAGQPKTHTAALVLTAGDELTAGDHEALLETLPPASRLRASIARYAREGRHEQIVALCAQRRQDVLALPPSELLVSQLLDAHLAEAQRQGNEALAAAGRELALAFLPELERLRQSEGIRARLHHMAGEPEPQPLPEQAPLAEQLAALVAIAPAERLATLQSLYERYPRASGVRVALADTYAALGDVERALELYRSDRSADEVVERAAELLLSVGRAREALAELEGRSERSPRMIGLRGAALVALGDVAQARPLLERAWDAGERSATIALAYARALAAAGDLEGAAEPYQIVLEATPDALSADDCRVMADIAAGGGFGILSGEEEAVYLDRYVERAGRRLREQPDGTQLLRRRAELRRAAEQPERLRESLADWLEHLAASSDQRGIEEATQFLRVLRREGAVTRAEQFELLEGVEPYAVDVPGLADLLALEYQALALEELTLALRQGRPMPAYIGDLRRALHFLRRDLADGLARAIEEELRALAERSMEAPAQIVEEVPAVSLADVRITLVGGHVATRREVERELREQHGLTDYLEVPPSSEGHIDRGLVRDRTTGRDLVVVITGYTGHDLTNIVRDLQRTGDIASPVIWPACRGKSGVVREILKSVRPDR